MTDATVPGNEGKPRTFGLLAFVGIAVGIVFSIAKAMIWSGGDFTAEALGYAMGSAAFPMLIAYLIAGRKKAWNPNLLSFSFCGMCFLLLLMEVRAHPVSWKTHVADLAREAAGTKAPSDSETSPDPQIDAVIRGMMGDILKIRQAHDAETARYSDAIKQLYTTESFSSANAMRRSLDAVSGVFKADQDFSEQFARWKEQVETRVSGSAMPEQKKQDFLKGFSKSLGDSKVLKVREEIMASEARWASSTVDLYNFALNNTAKLSVKGPDIVISDSGVKEQFDQRLKDSQKNHDDVQALNARLFELQREGMNQLGLTPEDLKLRGNGTTSTQ